MKMLIKFIPYFVIALMATAITFQQIHIKSLKKHRDEQTMVIKSNAQTIEELLKLKTYSFHFDCKLNVQDKSRVTLYGRNNKGTQIVPSVRTYELKIDSTNFIMSIKPPIE
jgi:hypothetical protein